MFIRDLQNNEYFLQGVIKHDQELNGDERIDIDIEYTDMNSEFLDKQDDLKMWIILFEGKEYRIISSKQTGFGNKYRISVTAVLYMLDWLNTSRIYQRIDGSLTVTEAFNIVFNDTPFTYSTVESAPSNSFEGIGEGETRLEIFKTFIDRFGYEFKIVGKVVYLYNQIGNDANFEYRYKVNTQDITKEVDASEMWTHAKGFGDYSDDDSDTDVIDKAKLKREYTSPLEAVIGVRREAPPIRDGRVTQQATMDANLKKIVDESVQISFTADIYDMSQQGYNYQHAVIGDRVFLVDERIGLDTEIRVVKISKSVNDLEQTLDMEITFGTGNIADQYGSKLSTAAKDIADLIQGRKSLPFAALDIVSKSMVSKIQNSSNELVYDDQGIHAIDKNNPNNIVTYNSQGWMISTDGGRTAKTVATADGIVANSITSGSILTSLVDIVGRNGLMTMNGDEFVAKSNVDNRKTVVSPKGLNVTRPDGAVWIENGMFKSALDIQMAMPQPLSTGVEIIRGYYVTANTEKSYVEEYFFQHKARYLNIKGRGLMHHLTSTKYNGMVYVEDPGENDILANQLIPSNKEVDSGDPGEFIDLTIDLGLPDYGYKHFYIMVKSSSGNSEVYFRRSLIELKD